MIAHGKTEGKESIYLLSTIAPKKFCLINIQRLHLLPTGVKLSIGKTAKGIDGYFKDLNLLLNEGELAQLVERLHGMQEVSGSTPLFSTKSSRKDGFFLRTNDQLLIKQTITK